MLLKINDAEYLGNYRVRLAFNDGRNGIADLHALIDAEPPSVFAAFAEEALVRQYRLEHGTLCWPGERDVAPEYLYFLSFQDDPALRETFAEWGYLSATIDGKPDAVRQPFAIEPALPKLTLT